MKGYPKFRIFLLLGMLAAAVFLVSDRSWAQTTAPVAGAADAAAPAKKVGLLTLILGHPDAVFFTIATLSVIGLSLIIQGFIKNRASVFMPEASTNTMREMIQARRFQELLDY